MKDTNLDTYTPLRIGNVPELEVEFIDSTEAPVGLGESGATVVAPAIGNAVFAAVGIRLRRLPSGQTPHSAHRRAKVECNAVLGVMWRELHTTL